MKATARPCEGCWKVFSLFTLGWHSTWHPAESSQHCGREGGVRTGSEGRDSPQVTRLVGSRAGHQTQVQHSLSVLVSVHKAFKISVFIFCIRTYFLRRE